MLDNDRLRDRLAELARTRRSGGAAAAAAVTEPANGDANPSAATPPRRWVRDVYASPPSTPSRVRWYDPDAPTRERRANIEEFLPGGEWRDARGAVYVHERLRSQVERPATHWGTLGTPPEEEEDLAALAERGLRHVLFLDLETGGLASSPVFLAGTMHWNGEDFVLRQYFARHYGEEGALLRAVAEQAAGFDHLVTFNGKSYDVPFLTARAVVHGVRLRMPERHVDLLHPSRRRWKTRLPDCRLQTLELHVCKRRRTGDVPSDEVPALYHDFVRRGDPYRLVPVFHHNLLDVITMAEVLRALCAVERRAEPDEDGFPWRWFPGA